MNNTSNIELKHGGQLPAIAQQYNIPIANWLDLSTGISPYSYPIPPIPNQYWQDLPHINPALIKAVQAYYQAKYCLPCPGSQAIIERLPSLWQQRIPQAKTVYLPKVGYKEHQKAWIKAGFDAKYYDQCLPKQIAHNAVVVIINPNNPSGQLYSQEALLLFYQQVKAVQGLLVIDEAFIDVMPDQPSLITEINDESLIVLRSFGKFFGLAGLRIGFVFGSQAWIQQLKQTFGPWQVNGPAQYIAQRALQDSDWQQHQRQRLIVQAEKLRMLIDKYLSTKYAYCPLFITVYLDNAKQLFHQLCLHGIYVRLTDEEDSLRFGIAKDEDLVRLNKVLSHLL